MEIESINPNTPVEGNADSSGESNLGSGPVTFDELEEVTSKKPEKKESKKEEKSSDKKEEKKPEKNPDLSKDSDKGAAKKDDKEDKSKKSADKKDGEEGQEPEVEEKPARKTVKAKYEETELDIDEEAMVPVKINGKEEMVPVKELLSNYSGKTAWDKKFTDLSRREKEFSSRDMKVREVADMIRAVHEETDPEMKIFRMSQIAGVDPIEFRKKFFADTHEILEKNFTMSDDERRAAEFAFEAKVNKHRADTLQKRIDDEQAYTALKSRVDDLRARHQISEDEFESRYEALEANEDKMSRMHGDKYQRARITPELVTEFVVKDRLWASAEEKLNSLEVKLTGPARDQKILQIVNDAYQTGLSPQDVSDVLEEVYGEPKRTRTIQKKKAQADEFKYGSKPSSKPASESKEVTFFDDL